MSPDRFLDLVINPGLRFLEGIGGPAPTNNARRFMLAIALQESGPGLAARYQNSPSSSPGPARGFWQFEQGGGVAGVLTHPSVSSWSNEVCKLLEVVNQAAAAWRAIEGNDVLAACFARLLIYTDPAALPTEQDAAWNYYLRTWRPGKPHQSAWPSNWSVASRTVENAA
jgi:hypothetical protein